MKRKILKISILLLLILSVMSTVYAAELKCNVTIVTNKTEMPKGEEFSVDVKVSNIQSERGVISFGATLEYDKDSLELVRFEEGGKWDTPEVNSSYNAENGKIAITRAGLGNSDETIFTMIFKPKEGSKENPEINLKDVMVANGIETPVRLENAITKTIKVVAASATPTPSQSPAPTTVPSTIPTAAPTPTPNSGLNSLPKTGEGTLGTVLIFGGAVTIAAAIFFFVEMKLIRKK